MTPLYLSRYQHLVLFLCLCVPIFLLGVTSISIFPVSFSLYVSFPFTTLLHPANQPSSHPAIRHSNQNFVSDLHQTISLSLSLSLVSLLTFIIKVYPSSLNFVLLLVIVETKFRTCAQPASHWMGISHRHLREVVRSLARPVCRGLMLVVMSPATTTTIKHTLELYTGWVHWFAPEFSASGWPVNYGQWAVYFAYMTMEFAGPKLHPISIIWRSSLYVSMILVTSLKVGQS